MRGAIIVVGCLLLGSGASSCAERGDRPADRSSLTAFPVHEAAAVVRGRVIWKGESVPRVRPLPIPLPDAPEIVNPKWEVDAETRGVPHAFVEVLGIEDRWRFDAKAEAVVLRQEGLRYRPFVAGALVGQEVVVENHEDILHNFKWTGRRNGTFNQNLEKGARASVRFRFPETVHFQCDVQNWMDAWVYVREHSIFAVTTKDGSFELPKLPPGTYEISVRHPNPGWEGERRGIQVREGDRSEIVLTIRSMS